MNFAEYVNTGHAAVASSAFLYLSVFRRACVRLAFRALKWLERGGVRLLSLWTVADCVCVALGVGWLATAWAPGAL